MRNQILIELKNDKARNLLQDLVDLNINEVIKESILPKIKISERFKGFLTKDEGKSLKNHITKSREEWATI